MMSMRLGAFGMSCEIECDVAAEDALDGLDDLMFGAEGAHDNLGAGSAAPDPDLIYRIERVGPHWLERCWALGVSGVAEPLLTGTTHEVRTALLDDIARRAARARGALGLGASVVTRNDAAMLVAPDADDELGTLLDGQMHPMLIGALAAAGWSVVSNRQSAVDPTKDRPVALPFWRPIEPGVTALDTEDGVAPPTHRPTPLSASAALATAAPLTAIVTTSAAPDGGGSGPGRPTATLRTLLGRLLEAPSSDVSVDLLDTLADVAEAVPSFTVSYAIENPLTVVGTFDAIAASLAKSGTADG